MRDTKQRYWPDRADLTRARIAMIGRLRARGRFATPLATSIGWRRSIAAYRLRFQRPAHGQVALGSAAGFARRSRQSRADALPLPALHAIDRAFLTPQPWVSRRTSLLEVSR